MALQLHKESHVDHVSKEVIDFVLAKFPERNGFFIETFTLPDHLPTLECGLYGPAMGDLPISESEVTYAQRPNRVPMTRFIDKPKRPTRICTVIAGKHDGQECVLFTVYGGPCAPREPGDPDLKGFDAESEAKCFWSQHALAK